MKTPAILTTIAAALLSGCAEKVNVPPVANFNAKSYMGTWYEIARLDHSFERGLEKVNATYTPNPDGTFNVLNKGYSTASGQWKEARAKAVATNTPGQFKVYFVPFIGGNYQIAMVNPDYTQAVVSGGTKEYLWFLSKTPTISESDQKKMIQAAQKLGYDTSKLIYVKQTQPAATR